MVNLITDNIDIWTTAQTHKANGVRGRGNNSNAQSPHGIKKLRELILELAVRGKLVPQDPNDEPASLLLDKIAKEKARLVKEGKIKKQNPLPKIREDEKPFKLPVGWEWTRLGATGLGSTGKTPSTSNPKYYDGAIPFLGPGQITPDGVINDSDKTLTEEGCEYSVLAESGDILMVCIGGSIGKSAIVQSKVSFNQQINCIRPLHVDSSYLNIAINTPHFQTSIFDASSGSATPIINRSKWEGLLVALPPSEEQHRIVSKVNELMALCDQLEQQQTDSNAIHQTLVETLLTTLTSAVDQNEFAGAWQRIAINFDTIFTTEHSIDQLKQTILQLAVMGKLVPQDSNDEPASVLLEKIAKEKARLIKEGKIKKQNPIPEISEDEKPFELPNEWSWTRLGTITLINPRNEAQDDSLASFIPMPLVTTSYTGEHGQEERIWGSIKQGYTHFANGDIGLAKITPCFENSKAAVFSNLKNGIGAGTTELHIARPFGNTLCARYVLLYLKTPQYLLMGEAKMTGTAGQKRVPKDFFAANPFPLPPLTEQHRIVAKVDELMALCDALNARLIDAQTTQVQLADAIVEQAVG